MTEAQARTTANVVLAAATIGALYYVLKTPPLRRRVWQLARAWAVGPLAAWGATEIRRAWDESASARMGSSASYGETSSASARTGLPPGYRETVAPATARATARKVPRATARQA